MLREPSRYPHVPYPSRPRLVWPNGARIAVWVVPNIEFYELDPPTGPVRPAWLRPTPDVLGYSLRDYGNRAGIWRIFEALDRHGIRASVSLNAAVCEHLPEIVQACLDRDWELFAHGIYNTRWIYGMSPNQVREVIKDSVETIRAFSGKPVRGWLSPAVSSTEDFFDLLPEFGIDYTIDMVHDDQPTPICVKSGRLISIPYSSETNDIRVMGMRGYSPADWAKMLKAAFDRLHEEGEESGTVFCIPLHPYIVGQPHRIAALEDVLGHIKSRDGVWFATGSEIADCYYETFYAAAMSTAGSVRS
ncbi:MAG: polysaccharide deacetylase family protein [Proteobacteria bacterium]|nr:polysaccharide deacetylase family protein [Pseudomonadota bacterium]